MAEAAELRSEAEKKTLKAQALYRLAMKPTATEEKKKTEKETEQEMMHRRRGAFYKNQQQQVENKKYNFFSLC